VERDQRRRRIEAPVTSRRQLARNTVWNLFAQVIPALVAVIAVPYLIAGLGSDRFGVLTIAWTTVGYFSLFDFGLGRALTQAASIALGESNYDRLQTVALNTLVIMFGLGLVGGLFTALFSSVLVTRFLNVAAPLRAESIIAFRLLALSLPFVVMTSGLRGLLEAHQDFAIATALRIPFAFFTFLAPLAVLPFSHSLVAVIGVLIAGRIVLWAAHLIVCLQRYSYLGTGRLTKPEGLADIVATGGWMTVSNVISPLMVVADRFLIGAMFTMAAVAYYVTPFEMVFRLLIVPSAVLGVFFPAYANAHGRSPETATALFGGSLRVLIFLMFPATLLLCVFAPEILLVWVGPDYAKHGTSIMQWLTIGVFINALAQVPYSALQALGRPDLTAKLHSTELPIYLGSIVLFGRWFGLTGVAIAWTFRIVLDTTVLFLLSRNRIPNGARAMRGPLVSMAALALVVGGLCLIPALRIRLIGSIVIFAAFVVVAWKFGLRRSERDSLLALIGLRAPSPASAT
jgi:O-antigen/teichoic acid export membrane protein